MGQLQNQFQQMMGGQSPYSGGGGQRRGNFGTPGYQQPQTRGSGAYSGMPQTQRPQQPWSEFEPQRPQQQPPMQRGIDGMPGRGGYGGQQFMGPPQQAPPGTGGFKPEKGQQEPSLDEMERAVNAKYAGSSLSAPFYKDQAAREQGVRQAWAEDQRRAALTPQQQQAENAQKQAQQAAAFAAAGKGQFIDLRNAQPQQGTTAPPTQQGYIPQQSQADMVSGQGQTGGFKPEKGQPQLSGPPMMPPTRQPPVQAPPPGTGGIKPAKPMQVQASQGGAMTGGSVSQPLRQMQPNYYQGPPQAPRETVGIGGANPYRKPSPRRPDGGPEYMDR